MIKHEFDSYEGEFKEGLYHGHGIRIRPHGELYRGEFKNNKYNGIGELKNLLGNKGMYVTHYGEFKDNQRHGIGLQLNSNEFKRKGCSAWLVGWEDNHLSKEYKRRKELLK